MRLALATLLAIAAGALVGAVAVGGLGVALGYALFADDEPVTGLPAAVLETHAALLEAAESGDYEALRALFPEHGPFEYTFGAAVDGGPIAYWQQLEATTNERPLETLAAILKMPYALSRGYYVWPWSYTLESPTDVSEHEQELLAPIGTPNELIVEGTGYLGWRTGVAPDGTWVFYLAGD